MNAQSRCLKPYIEIYTKKRQPSRDQMEEIFFELMKTSCYGKVPDSKRNRINVKLVQSHEYLLTETGKLFFKSFIRRKPGISFQQDAKLF